MNHSYTPNARIVFVRFADRIQPWIQACVAISPEEDICRNYGSGYWRAKGIVPIPHNEISIYQSGSLALCAVPVEGYYFSHALVANDELFAITNFVYHEVYSIQEHKFIIIIHDNNETFEAIMLDQNGNMINNDTYGPNVFRLCQKRLAQLVENYGSEWKSSKNIC